MGKRLNLMKKIQCALIPIGKANKQLYKLADKTNDKELKALLYGFVERCSTLNYNFSKYLLEKIYEGYKKDKIDMEFKKLINPLEKEFKKKGKK